MRAALLVLLLTGAGCFLRQGQSYSSFTIPRPLEREDCLVVGFLGGRARWDADNRFVRRLALGLRERDVRVETVENSKKDLALRLIHEAFDRDADGALEPNESDSAKVLLYGHSFGGAAVPKLARRLDERGVPVRLTVQVDSIGFGDAIVPPNVDRAANFYQRDGWFVRGEKEIRAADPDRTEILGNFRRSYADSDIDLSGLVWFKRLFQTAHLKMGNDPELWREVERLLVEELTRAGCLGDSDQDPPRPLLR